MSVSQSVITTLLPTEHMVHYTRSVLYECVAESQSLGPRPPAGAPRPRPRPPPRAGRRGATELHAASHIPEQDIPLLDAQTHTEQRFFKETAVAYMKAGSRGPCAQ